MSLAAEYDYGTLIYTMVSSIYRDCKISTASCDLKTMDSKGIFLLGSTRRQFR